MIVDIDLDKIKENKNEKVWMKIDGELKQITKNMKIEHTDGPLVIMIEPNITEEENERRWQEVKDVMKEIAEEKNREKYESMSKKIVNR